MAVIISAATALVISVLLIFINSIILKASLIAVVIFILFYNILTKKRNISDKRQSEQIITDSREEFLAENKRLSVRLEEVESAYRSLSIDKSEIEGKSDDLIDDASDLCTVLPIIKKMASLIIDKTEQSAINLTDNIFQISTKSSKVGNHISSFLNDMFSGEKSLKNHIDVLNREMSRIDKLIEDFSTIKKRYTADMKHIEENVNVINSYLSGIRDVSDRTALLAINSSIEAARVGASGKGFSVLAGEIQGLASSSKEISLQIDEIVEVISHTVEDSFTSLESEISVTLEELSAAQGDLLEISSSLNDKVLEVESHAKDSDSLSKTVTEQLNNVSVNMQYQDITRQILEHIISTLYFYRKRMEEREPRIIAGSDMKDKTDRILRKASSFFTIEDEWNLFGLEKAFSGTSAEDDNGEFKGNVELF